MIELLNLWQLQSVNVAAEQNVNSLFIIYVILSLIINRPSLLMAYLFSEALFQLSFFDSLSEWNLYAIECIMYTYVFSSLSTVKSKYACSLIIAFTIYFIFDAYYYGDGGEYGSCETILYKNIESVFTFAHLFFICSFISFGGIRDALRDFFGIATGVSRDSYNLLVFWYNNSKPTNKERL